MRLGGFEQRFRQIFTENVFSATHYDCAFDGIFEFAHVAGPIVSLQQLLRCRRNSHNPAIALIGILRRKVVGQHRNVFDATAQGGHFQFDNVEPEKQIVAEISAGDGGVKILVSRGDHANVDLDWLVAADALEFALLQHSQQLRLQPRRELANFIKKNCAAIGKLQTAFALIERARERALLVVEQFALQ